MTFASAIILTLFASLVACDGGCSTFNDRGAEACAARSATCCYCNATGECRAFAAAQKPDADVWTCNATMRAQQLRFVIFAFASMSAVPFVFFGVMFALTHFDCNVFRRCRRRTRHTYKQVE